MDLQKQLGPEWYTLLGPLFEEDWMANLGKRISAAETLGYPTQPRLHEVFRAYEYVQPSQLKVLMIGQDPYPNGQADGFAFSTRDALPPLTLRIVFDELEREGYGKRYNPNLVDWAEQGVMMLNTCLTCSYKMSLSHQGWGWEKFIAATLDHINDLNQPFVVMAWGSPAKALVREHILREGNRIILEAIHPVAQSRSEGRLKFVGCRHFEHANEFLKNRGVEPIEWVNNAPARIISPEIN